MLVACALCLVLQVGDAHPLGDYSINQYLVLDLRVEQIDDETVWSSPVWVSWRKDL